MFYAYGVSVQGADHIKNDVVCQDSHKIVKCGDDMVIAAVADGLGSEKYTDVASRLAVDTATAYCADHIKPDDACEDILSVIKASFTLAQRSIEKTAEDAGHDFDQYDTTLSLAVVIRDELYFGHSGDSGILVMSTDGAFYKVTQQQRDEWARVFPLAFDDHWVFGKYDKKAAGGLLATDGMLESFFPIYLRNETVDIHVPLVRFFMDREKLSFESDGEEAVTQKMEEMVKGIDPAQVSDDKTVLAIVNNEIECEKQPDEYYAQPDWEALRKKYIDEWKRAAYPALFEDEQKQNETDEDAD